MIQRLAFKTHMIVTTTNSQTIDDIAQFKNGQHSYTLINMIQRLATNIQMVVGQALGIISWMVALPIHLTPALTAWILKA